MIGKIIMNVNNINNDGLEDNLITNIILKSVKYMLIEIKVTVFMFYYLYENDEGEREREPGKENEKKKNKKKTSR